tara:strand:- start:478 stop:681 length:204 start_codon:yes stop_codon:yes gene_type:complete
MKLENKIKMAILNKLEDDIISNIIHNNMIFDEATEEPIYGYTDKEKIINMDKTIKEIIDYIYNEFSN